MSQFQTPICIKRKEGNCSQLISIIAILYCNEQKYFWNCRMKTTLIFCSRFFFPSIFDFMTFFPQLQIVLCLMPEELPVELVKMTASFQVVNLPHRPLHCLLHLHLSANQLHSQVKMQLQTNRPNPKQKM